LYKHVACTVKDFGTKSGYKNISLTERNLVFYSNNEVPIMHDPDDGASYFQAFIPCALSAVPYLSLGDKIGPLFSQKSKGNRAQ
jgi:hypothetical protein